jgi:hypothetical protein
MKLTKIARSVIGVGALSMCFVAVNMEQGNAHKTCGVGDAITINKPNGGDDPTARNGHGHTTGKHYTGSPSTGGSSTTYYIPWYEDNAADNWLNYHDYPDTYYGHQNGCYQPW